jgi:hypothetical protein
MRSLQVVWTFVCKKTEGINSELHEVFSMFKACESIGKDGDKGTRDAGCPPHAYLKTLWGMQSAEINATYSEGAWFESSNGTDILRKAICGFH